MSIKLRALAEHRPQPEICPAPGAKGRSPVLPFRLAAKPLADPRPQPQRGCWPTHPPKAVGSEILVYEIFDHLCWGRQLIQHALHRWAASGVDAAVERLEQRQAL